MISWIVCYSSRRLILLHMVSKKTHNYSFFIALVRLCVSRRLPQTPLGVGGNVVDQLYKWVGEYFRWAWLYWGIQSVWFEHSKGWEVYICVDFRGQVIKGICSGREITHITSHHKCWVLIHPECCMTWIKGNNLTFYGNGLFYFLAKIQMKRSMPLSHLFMCSIKGYSQQPVSWAHALFTSFHSDHI